MKLLIASNIILRQILIAFVLLIIFIYASFLSLKIITHHGEGLSVPDFTGLEMKQVNKIADEKDLNFKIIDSVYNAPGKKGTVIAQVPPAGFKVKEGRTILLTIKTFNPQRILMPDFTNVSLIQAKADIETYGLRIGNLKYVPDIATNNVLEQIYNGRAIKPGTPIEKNSVIDLILGMGKSDKITIVPDLLNLTKDEAFQKATDLSLNIGALVFDNSVISTEDSLNAVIWKQTPIPNTQTTIGSSIDVWLSLELNK
ncbi:MAG: PASTA domain-containing protein [Bacteroidales bacterium]|nr:PASTA domain-containing protein [Bacteroidales bacterium]